MKCTFKNMLKLQKLKHQQIHPHRIKPVFKSLLTWEVSLRLLAPDQEAQSPVVTGDHIRCPVTDLISILATSQVCPPSNCWEAFLNFQTKGQLKLTCSHANVTELLKLPFLSHDMLSCFPFHSNSVSLCSLRNKRLSALLLTQIALLGTHSCPNSSLWNGIYTSLYIPGKLFSQKVSYLLALNQIAGEIFGTC